MDAVGEFAVVKPYTGLPDADDLVRLTDQYWQAATDDDWGSCGARKYDSAGDMRCPVAVWGQ